ncbi:alginate lyase family protein [uncultured Kriegella sp.]|uniref:alginate lyase family protein n=1 Tax=uncultured Kriegella sp. TaxID=1798910 RepID=UPI0030D6F1C9|tara:strand:- start:69859 stop:71106 length:1248 start_codon:yes stop_codon:yes gene_type:complete
MIKVGKSGCALVLLILFGATCFSAPLARLDSVSLAMVKQKIHGGTASERTRTAYKQLLENAEQLLTMENPTVMDKSIIPPSGNKHDYLSIGRYWWPNPDTSNGMPWVRKDGETNPDTQTGAVDRNRLSDMTNGVENLSLAYYFSEDERYAHKAISILKTWFLDEETLMNPHLEFAQSIPGNPEGRPFGVLDGRAIASLIPNAIDMLSDSQHWTTQDDLKMTRWLTSYLTWLTESDLGKEEGEQENNHGSWYRFQVASLAHYLGNKPLIKKMVELAQQSLDRQLNNKGGQIHELERTRSFFYSCFNLDALTNIAAFGDEVGMDMWHFESDEGKSLALAINYLTSVISGEDWQHPSHRGVDLSYLVPILARASVRTKSKEFSNFLTQAINELVKKEKVAGLQNKVLQELSLRSNLTF